MRMIAARKSRARESQYKVNLKRKVIQLSKFAGILCDFLETEMNPKQKKTLLEKIKTPNAHKFEFKPKELSERSSYNQFMWMLDTKYLSSTKKHL